MNQLPETAGERAAKRLRNKAKGLRAAKAQIEAPEHCELAVADALDEAAAIVEDVARVCIEVPTPADA